MASKYDNAQQFIDDCKAGMDITFLVDGIGYGVLGWYDGGPLAYRQDDYGYYEKHFPDADSLLDGFVINGHPLRSIITRVTLD